MNNYENYEVNQHMTGHVGRSVGFFFERSGSTGKEFNRVFLVTGRAQRRLTDH